MKFKKTANQPRWRKEQKKKKRKLVRQVFVRAITVFGIFAILFLSLKIWQTFKNSCWDGKHEINFIVQAEDVVIFSFNPQRRFLNILKIPTDTYIPVAKGYGEYKIKNIYKLGQMEKIGGGKLLNNSVQSFFSIPIDGWIKIKDSKKLKDDSLMSFFWMVVKKQTETNLSWWDLSRLFWQTKNLAVDQVNKTDLKTTNLIDKNILSDGTEAYKFENNAIDDLVIKIFSDEDVLEENIQVLVLNATNHLGLAKDMARVVKNLGAELIGVKDQLEKSQSSQIFCQTKKQADSYTAQRISKAFDIKIKNEKLENQEVDLVIVLGEDFWQQFYSSNY